MNIRLIKAGRDRDGQVIYLATNLFKERRKDLIRLYRDRWEVETFFDRLKNMTYFKKTKAKDFNGILQEFFVSIFLLQLSGKMISDQYEKIEHHHRRKYKFSYKACLHRFSDFFIELFYGNNTLNRVLNIIYRSIQRSKYKFRANRKFERYSKQSQSINTKYMAKKRREQLLS